MHLLVMRFSAIGDVALSLPVIAAVLEKYPDLKITVLTQRAFEPLFSPLRVTFAEADIKGRHDKPGGVLKLYRSLRKEINPDKVADLHRVLRTQMLNSLFRLDGTPVYKIDKGRKEKKELTRKENKVLKPLKPTWQRYADVFAKAGFPVKIDENNPVQIPYKSEKADQLWNELQFTRPVVGFAPLAGFPGKTWPVEKSINLIENLSDQGFGVVLFGGPGDLKNLEKIANDKTGVCTLAGKLNFAAEISFMKKMELMISMDSSNMHLAALAGIPIVSVWGATHYYAGFAPLTRSQNLRAEVPTDQLDCRPCSVFGKKPCFRKDYACLNWLKPETVMEKVHQAIQNSAN